MAVTRIGVLALQGDYALHARLLGQLGAEVQLVRRVEELAAVESNGSGQAGLSGLVIPGGESTTLRKLMRRSGLDAAIQEFASSRPVLGTCAGCILLASDLEDARGVEPLGLIDISVRRNGYGRQVDSFEAVVEGLEEAGPVAFIRAPRITRVGSAVSVFGHVDGEPVAVRQGLVSALTFHPEVTGTTDWHRAWLQGAFAGVA
ncbi:pyridoxal 5'-phosphate synthase glutaminase subunit PdxT [bacterium]|nr:MAG: pyridoxal 5'-phosphate synthase glutaminase subunit PdxT [bacterium]